MIEFYTNCFRKYDKIYTVGYRNGKRFKEILDDYKPYIFLPDPNGKFKTINGKPVTKKTFTSLEAARKVVNPYLDGNVEFYGMTNWVYPFLNDSFPGQVQFDINQISIVFLDIEADSRNGFPIVEKADSEITAITLSKNGKTITFGTKIYIPTDENKTYIRCENEKRLLELFLVSWRTHWQPDVVSGWSVEFFDIPYLVNRIGKILNEKAIKELSPFGFVEKREIVRAKAGNITKFDDRIEIVYDIAGITVLDYLQLYKKFTFTNHESYSLNHIAKVELGEGKVDYGAYGDLDTLYEKNPQLFYEYNIHDAVLPERLENKLGFIKQVINIAYAAKVNFVDAMTTLKGWDVIIHNYLMEKNIVVPQKEESEADAEMKGAFVEDVKPGMYKWVISFDFDALYPRIVSQHNVSPETFIGKQHSVPNPEHIVRDNKWPHNPDCITTGNGCMFAKWKRGFFPEIIDKFADQRKSIKDQMLDLERQNVKKDEIKRLDNYQQALKIMNNGFIGAIGNHYFRWYSYDLFDAVLKTAQTCTRYMKQEVNKYLNKMLKTDDVEYVIAADTDSIYITFNQLVVSCGLESQPPERITQILDQVCVEKIQPLIVRCTQDLCKNYNVYKSTLNMKREAICDRTIWRKSKNYALNIWANEANFLKEPQVKVKGIEVVRSSTPMVLRKTLKEVIRIILNHDERTLQRFIADFKKEYWKLSIEEAAAPRSINDLGEAYNERSGFRKGVAIHVRAAWVYNIAIQNLGLERRYHYIRDHDKIKWIYLKEPNPYGQNVIAFHESIPKKLELDEYFDRDLQFDKNFIKPVESLTTLIGWEIKPKSNLLSIIKS